MTDVSDGLLADLGHIAAASGVHIDLSLELLRTDLDVLGPAAEAAAADARQWVLGGGEDHALVATFPVEPRRAGGSSDGSRVPQRDWARVRSPLTGRHGRAVRAGSPTEPRGH